MLRSTVCLIVVAAILPLGVVAGAESSSSLLEKGIYTEETVGDLDAAIEIYEKIIAEGKANREFVAQAQFRRGKCLLKQGKREEAEEAFRELVNQFKDSPGQKELVEKARKLLPWKSDLKLDPAPWVDGEHLELRIKLGGGVDIGDFILSAQTGKVEEREVWHIRLNRNIAVNSPNLGMSHVIADSKTHDPISSTFRHSLLGTVRTDYSRNLASVRAKGVDGKESTREFELDGVYYDNEQGWQLFRQLPLTDDYKGTLPVCSPVGAGAIKLEMEVTGKETLEVPAGKFECYKLLVKPVQQTFWISTDAHRYPVKFEAGGIYGVLQSIRRVKPGDMVEYGDKELGFSLSAPADWYFIHDKASAGPPEHLAILTDPWAAAVSAMMILPTNRLSEKHRASARAWADGRVADSRNQHKDYRVRADSWEERTVAGQPAVSLIADYVRGETPMVQYRVVMVGESTSASIMTEIEPERFEEFRKEFDKIIASLRVK